MARFLEIPSENSFADVFSTFTPQLVSYFRARRCEPVLAEDLAQDVMVTIYRKSWQTSEPHAIPRLGCSRLLAILFAATMRNRAGRSKRSTWPKLVTSVPSHATACRNSVV